MTLQMRIVLAGKFRQLAEMLDCRSVEFLFEKGEELASNACPCASDIAVGRVLSPGLFFGFQVGTEVCASNGQQRPEDASGNRMNSAKPREPRAAQDMCQHGFCLVVRSVCHRNSSDAAFLYQPLEI